MAASDVVRYLWIVGVLCLFNSSSLFLRMAVELNKVLPPEKKFSLFEIRMHFHEIKSSHESFFPISALRTVWLILLVVSVSAMAIAVMLAIHPPR
jgi:hypothetical protein